mmetsp:Transcript_22779/g.65657  ORF Transcript_22779/g.65657 Transcript_22779/m.65657 type:complete len:257 (-) Transcript_22779:617-1387(-)
MQRAGRSDGLRRNLENREPDGAFLRSTHERRVHEVFAYANLPTVVEGGLVAGGAIPVAPAPPGLGRHTAPRGLHLGVSGVRRAEARVVDEVKAQRAHVGAGPIAPDCAFPTDFDVQHIADDEDEGPHDAAHLAVGGIEDPCIRSAVLHVVRHQAVDRSLHACVVGLDALLLVPLLHQVDSLTGPLKTVDDRCQELHDVLPNLWRQKPSGHGRHLAENRRNRPNDVVGAPRLRHGGHVFPEFVDRGLRSVGHRFHEI